MYVTRAIIFQPNLSKCSRSYIVTHSTFRFNCISKPMLDNQSQYSLIHSHAVDLYELEVFGSLCFASTLCTNKTKLEPSVRKMYFLRLQVRNLVKSLAK